MEDAQLLKIIPEAASSIPWRDSLLLKPFLQLDLWKNAMVEAMGALLFVPQREDLELSYYFF
jgi:hypothetical protein